jgi:cytochrome c oxidase cbb3-type subunit 3
VNQETKDRVLGHDFDGIQEYDNRLPNWWLAILFGTIVFGVLYWAYFQTFHTGKTPAEAYQADMARAAEARLAAMKNQAVTDESLLLMASVPDRVAAGRKIFEQFCVVCHGDRAQGNVGPNLTDAYWLHGGKPLQILNTVTNGVPDKGMVAWGNQLGPDRIQTVVAYVLSIKGTNVPGKAPQGEVEGASSGASGAGGGVAPADSADADSVAAK